MMKRNNTSDEGDDPWLKRFKIRRNGHKKWGWGDYLET